MVQKQSRTKLYVGLGCLALVVVIGCPVGACLAFGGGIYEATSAPADEAKAFLRDLRNSDYDAAYARMSADYRASHDFASFTAQVGAAPVFSMQTDDSILSRNVMNDTATMSGHLSTPERDVPISVELVYVDTWKVTAVRFSGTNAFP